MRRTRVLSRAAVLTGAALLTLAGTAGAAFADSSDSSADDNKPTEAGTSFRTATAIQPDQEATAEASTGDYLYWSFPADVGQRATVHATVKLPESAARHGDSTWQVDVYDGLRRHQACRFGAQTRTAAQDAATVELSCTLRTVRGWAEPWSNDPLPGTYYARLTVTDLKADDLGLPMQASTKVTTTDAGGAQAVDGALAKPLVPGVGTKMEAASSEPEDGWASGWWSSRWLWTAAGGVLGALAGIGGYCLTRGSGRPARVPAGM
ncbi:hypothetical protein M4V62_10040 [Streptomyces durmitorensis]|uniref:Secreted protein n=1 Tax=Streptomyces durmitorensis TaxID=319947 RepID=A0ABY4PP68_9ACTN|nr:hypothetical protein [Streptomyces durmitorensis]UQT55406.1 hypothetical protein M4V62_10040 [Streptomyces durmitorensis]